MLNMRWLYAAALSKSTGATLNDIREAATTLEETERTARRVLGSAHPITKGIERELQMSAAAYSARLSESGEGGASEQKNSTAHWTHAHPPLLERVRVRDERLERLRVALGDAERRVLQLPHAPVDGRVGVHARAGFSF